MDMEVEQKYNFFSENTVGLTDSKVIAEMNKLGLIKISSKKSDKTRDRLNISLDNPKYVENEKQWN